MDLGRREAESNGGLGKLDQSAALSREERSRACCWGADGHGEKLPVQTVHDGGSRAEGCSCDPGACSPEL